MAGTGPIGIGIRSGRRPDSLSSSSPDVIRGSPQPKESAWFPGSSPGMTRMERCVRPQKLPRPRHHPDASGEGPRSPGYDGEDTIPVSLKAL
jgi:hypothetical protein